MAGAVRTSFAGEFSLPCLFFLFFIRGLNSPLIVCFEFQSFDDLRFTELRNEAGLPPSPELTGDK